MKGADMKERPILFNGPMVRAILDGRKTQTRRVAKVPDHWSAPPARMVDGKFCRFGEPSGIDSIRCPYGQPGDRLWVRETWGAPDADDPRCPGGKKPGPADRIVYRANDAHDYQWTGTIPWRPSIHMPRWASRITLEVVSVRVERVQDITEADAIAEGVECKYAEGGGDARDWFHSLWDSINAARGFGWDADPWVWVVEFKVVKR